MKQKMFVICTSIAALHLVIGGAIMLGGCTGVQEDEPMPQGARIVKPETEQPKTETEPKAVEKTDAPVVEEPVLVEVPVEKPEVKDPKTEEKPAVQDPVIVAKPVEEKPVRADDIDYIIKKGDTYTKISKEFGVSLKDLMAYNPYPEKKLIPGRKIMIPATGKKITKKAFTPAVKVQKSYEAIPADGIYVVKKNDSFSKIAGRFGLRASDIAEYNNLPLTKAIQPGQKLRLPPRRAGVKGAARPSGKTAGKAASKAPANKAPAKPAAEENLNDIEAPSLDDTGIPEAKVDSPVQDATVAEIVTEDTTIAKLANEYACSEMDIRKQNPHLAADGNVKRGTRIVL